jgi:glycine/D-amino acid oxidase-like deaminating enzyme
MSRTADVVVIGGGIVGCTTAFFLAREGLRVVLLERLDVASGTSSACGGWILLQDKKETSAAQRALESRRLYDLLEEEAGVRVLRTGGLLVAQDALTWVQLQAHARALRAAGIHTELLDGTALREAEPGLADDLAGGLFCPDEAVVDPPDVCRRLAQAASQFRALVLTGHPAVAFDVTSGRITGVRTLLERIAAPWVVVACGVWSPEVAALAEVSVSVVPRRGHIAVVREALLRRPVLEFDYLEAKEAKRATSLGLGFVAQPHPDGPTLVGSSREFCGFVQTPDPEVVSRLWMRAVRFLPSLASRQAERIVVGLRPYTPLGHPLVGRCGPEGFLIATGHEGEGVTLAPVTAALVRDLVMGRLDRTGWEPEGFPQR